MAASDAPTQDALTDPDTTSALADVYGKTGPGGPTLPMPKFLQDAVGTMTSYGQSAVPQGFNPRAAPQDQRGAAPNMFQPGNPYESGAYAYDAPVVGGLGRIEDFLTQPGSPLRVDPEQQGNPLYALGPVGELAGPTAGAAEAIAGKFGQGARDLLGGKLPQFAAQEGGTLDPAKLSPLVQKQVEELKASGASDAEIADFAKTMAPPPEPRGITTAEGGTADAGLMTRALQTAAGQEGVPLSQHSLFADYALGGPKFPDTAANRISHGGDIGTATRAVMAGDADVINLLGDDMSNQLIQNKVADILRRTGLPEDVVRRGLFAEIAEGRGAAVDSLSPKAIADSASRFPPAPPSVVDANVAQVSAAVQDTRPMASLIDGMRQAGASDADIQQGLRAMGLSSKEAKAWTTPKAESAVPVAAEGAAGAGGGKPPVAGPPAAPPPPPSPQGLAHTLGSGALALFTDVPRAIALVGHLPLARQAAPLLADSLLRGDPAEIAQALGRTVTGVLSEQSFQAFRTGAIKNLTDSAGVGGWDKLILDLHGAPNQTEEFALRSIIGRIPVIAQVNRAYPAMLNSLRYGAAQAIVDMRRAAGVTIDAAERDRIINAVNLMSGRGAQRFGAAGIKFNTSQMSGLFFGPRYMVSEFQTVPSVVRSLAGVVNDLAMRRPLDPVEVFKVRAFAGYAATGVGIMKAMSMFGWNLDLDPRSRDFGMGVAPDGSRVDPWGGMGTVARLALNEALFAADALAGRKPRYGASTGKDTLVNFFEGKLNPGLATAAANTLNGQLPGGAPLPDLAGDVASGNIGQTASDAATVAFGGNTLQPLALEAATGGPPTSPTIGGVKPVNDGRFDLAKMLLAQSGMTIKNTQEHVNYDGLGAAPGDPQYGTGDILRTYQRLQDGTWHKADPEMPAPSTTIGSAQNQIKLDQFSAQRWVTALGQEREIELRQMLADPKWADMSQAEQQKKWDETVARADKVAGSNFLAHDLIQQTDPKAIVAEAVDGFIKQGSSYKDKAYWVASLDRAGKLTPDVKAAIDALKDIPPDGKEPIRADEYLRAAPLVHEYLSHVPYGTDAHPVGTPQDWAAVAAARQYESVRRDALVRSGTAPSLADQRAKMEVSASLAGVQRQLFLGGSLLENPARRALSQKYGTLLTRFLGTAPQTYRETDDQYQNFPASR